MATTTVFQDWLDQIDFSDYNTVYELYQAVDSCQGYGSFDVEPAKGGNDRWIVSSYDTEDRLLINGEKAKSTFLSIIENNYCENMGIEGFYAYHHAMEKDD